MSETRDRWATFAGGLLLGGVVATGTAYVAFKYGPTWQNRWIYSGDEPAKAGQRRRHARPSSPAPTQKPLVKRPLPSSNGSANGGGSAPSLARTGTDIYYEIPRWENGAHSTPDKDHARNTFAPGPGHRRVGSGRSSLPPPPPSAAFNGLDTRHPLYTIDATTPGGGGRDTQSESEAINAIGMKGGHTRSAIFAGPADRGNHAVAEALRFTAAPSSALAAAVQQAEYMHHHASAPPTTPGSSNIKYGESPGGLSGTGHMMRSPGLLNGPTQSTPSHSHSFQAPPGPSVMIPQNNNTPQSLANTMDVLATEGRIIEDAALHEHYSRVITPEPPQTEETEEVCYLLRQALEERNRWLFKSHELLDVYSNLQEATKMRDCFGGDDPFECQLPVETPLRFEMVSGVMAVYDPTSATPDARLFSPPGTATDFFSTLHWLMKVSALGHVRSFTHQRLQLLEQKFNLHVMLNADKEFLAQKSAPHRDFYNVRKVDTHVHHSACMHQKHLLRFIKSKLKKEPDEVVIFRDGKYLTLKEVFESLNLTPYQLSVDTLDVHADKNIFHRFDKFNLKYNPFGQSRLREVFIKQDNLIHGRFLAELTREVFVDLEASKYQHTEYRISVYGRKPIEWDTLAAWVVQNRLYSDNNMWMIQVPRLYNVYKNQGIIESFQQLLDNIFTPLFEVSIDPGSHPMLHLFLRHVSGFDLVDDESKPERRPSKHMPTPEEWTSKHNPAYAYYAYYMYANLYSLNKLREARGLNTFSLRPHAGEAGDLDHLAATFLLSENIAHGINLRKSPCLQYLYYAAQVGLCMSPLSNNSLFLDYHKNPFPQFFARGLSVSLSTDDPLQIHLTREPLVEEYSVAAQVWKFSGTDLCEIARNSVLHSGFPTRLKMHWVHTEFWRSGPEGNSIQKTNVPSLRMVFRRDCHVDELTLLASGAAAHAARVRAKDSE